MILSNEHPPLHDQNFIKARSYPALYEGGIVPSLIAVLFNSFREFEPISSNAIFRTFAGALYILTGGLLFWSIVRKKTPWLFFPLILLLFTSAYPFLWLSNEVLTGIFLMLILWSVANGLPFFFSAIFIVLFSLTKPDLIFPGLLVGIYLAFNSEATFSKKGLKRIKTFISFKGIRWLKKPLINIAILIVLLLAFLLPGIFDKGFSFFKGPPDEPPRALISFGQHYADAVNYPDAWTEWDKCIKAEFGPVNNIGEIIINNFDKYKKAVFILWKESYSNLQLSHLLILLPVIAFCFGSIRQKKIKTIILLFLANFIPILLLSFIHVRYIARFYPLALFAILMGLINIRNRKAKLLIIAYLACVLISQIQFFIPYLKIGFYLPD